MSFLIAYFYDRVMAGAEQACLKEWRRELLNQVYGEVLEIGAGTGANIEHYPENVTRLVLNEPDPYMRKVLARHVAASGRDNIHIIDGTAEAIKADDAAFDFVVSSLVCCSLGNPETGFREIGRVLRPGGRLVFLEHVAAEQGTSRRRWQDRINPLWKTMMGNCHLNRETEQTIRLAGFRFVDIKRESMRKAMPIVRPTIRGMAEKVRPVKGAT